MVEDAPIAASGKVILFGEHAVVYGHPALAAGIPRALVAASVEAAGDVRVSVPEWGLSATDADPGPVADALRRVASALPGQGGCSVFARASVPAGAGLGSSAALSVLVARCLARVRGLPLDDGGVRAAAHQGERAFHGTPSGLDGAVAACGGFCLFRRAGWADGALPPVRSDRVAPDLLRLRCAVPALAIGLTGVSRSTSAAVASVRTLRERDLSAVEAAFAAISASLSEGLAGLAARDLPRLGRAMDACHGALRSLSLSCPELERLVESARAAGALGAKLTGGGRGGAVVALAGPGGPGPVLGAWAKAGFGGFATGGGEAT